MSGPVPTPGGLSVSSALVDGTVNVSLKGELDLASAPYVEERLSSIHEEDPARIVLDLAELAFIDSTGLRTLLLADARARERGYEFTLRGTGPTVRRVFEMTGALDVLRFES